MLRRKHLDNQIYTVQTKLHLAEIGISSFIMDYRITVTIETRDLWILHLLRRLCVRYISANADCDCNHATGKFQNH